MSNQPMIDDRTLISGVLRGEKTAQGALIRQHERLVAHMVGRLIRRIEDREEICQDVFLKVFEKLTEFNFESKLSTWVATIAYRQAINHLRGQKLTFEEFPEDERWTERFVEQEDPGTLLESRDEEEKVMQMVGDLPAQYRVVVTLYHLDGMSYAEIGSIMDMPEGTVKSYLFRARNLLKNRLVKLLKA